MCKIYSLFKRKTSFVLNVLIYLTLFSVFLSSCASLRANHEENIQNANLSQPNQKQVVLIPSEELEKKRSDLFNRAYRYMQLAAYTEAAKLWREYNETYFGMKQSTDAQFYYAKALFYLSRYDEAAEVLKPLLEYANNHYLFINGRLLFAEIQIKQLKYDQAIAATYDLMPETALEKKSGIIRASSPVILDDEEKIKILTMRGRIFAELKKENNATETLMQARKILKTIRFAGTEAFQKEQKDILTAHVAYRQIETVTAICKNKVYKPNKMSEAEFIQYAQDYYDCTKPTQSFMCEVLQVQDNQVRNSAILAYKDMAEFPIHFKNDLPNPARALKTKQKEFYKSEMTNLIDSTVQKFSKDFRNIRKCDVYDLF